MPRASCNQHNKNRVSGRDMWTTIPNLGLGNVAMGFVGSSFQLRRGQCVGIMLNLTRKNRGWTVDSTRSCQTQHE